MKLRTKKSFFKTLPEEKPKKRVSIKISSLLYFGFLFGIVLYIVIYTGKHYMYLEAKGFVELEKYLIKSEVNGKVSQSYIQHGNKISKNQALIQLKTDARQPTAMMNEILKTKKNIAKKLSDLSLLQNTLRQMKVKTLSKLPLKNYPAILVTPELLKTKKNISLKKAELVLLKQRMKATNQEFATLSHFRLLELRKNTRNYFEKLTTEKTELNYKIKGLETHIRYLEHYLADLVDAGIISLKSKIDNLKNEIASLKKYQNELANQKKSNVHNVFSPVDGNLYQIYKRLDEYVAQGEVILALIEKQAAIRISAYFNVKALTYLIIGKQADISFPDGVTGKGAIAKIFSSASPYVEPLTKNYIPIETSIKAEIIPINEIERTKWQKYDQMYVKVRLNK